MQPPGRGRRSNGLDARGWVALVDIDPRLAETVLELLSTAGIAAYVEPSPGAVGSYLEVRLPTTPTDRLFVDPVRRQEARSLTDQALAEHTRMLAEEPPSATAPTGTADDEAVWADLVARLTGPDTGEVPPWPVDEDLDAPPPTRGRLLRRRSDVDSDPDGEIGADFDRDFDRELDGNDASRWLDPAAADHPQAAADDVEATDEHFVPPPPPPVGRVTRATAISLVGFAIGLLLMIKPDWIGLFRSDGTFAAGLLIMLAAFGWLIYRLSDGPPLDSGPDDGAVV